MQEGNERSQARFLEGGGVLQYLKMPLSLSLLNFQDDYRAWDIQKSGTLQATTNLLSPYCEIWKLTTFQDDYVPREIKPRQSCKPSPAVERSTIPFSGKHKSSPDYVPHLPEFKLAVVAKRQLQATRPAP